MNQLQSNQWNNTHHDLLKVSNDKLYTFHSDIYIEKPFFDEILQKYNAKKCKHKVYEKETYKGLCPACGKNLGFYSHTKDSNTYLLVCPNPPCIFPNGKKSMLLHEVIKEYGGIVLFEKWRKARYTKKEAYGWKGIKPENRRKIKS